MEHISVQRGLAACVLLLSPFPFLHRLYNSTLQVLSLVSTDALSQILPLAAATVDTESTETWTYFLRLAVRHMPKLNTNTMVLMSDRCKGLENAVAECCPAAHHVVCAVHLVRNVSAHFGAAAAEEIKGLVYEAANATREQVFQAAMDAIKKKSSDIHDYLAAIPPAQWSQAGSTVPHFRISTSNAAESLNSVLRTARQQGPLAVFIKLRNWLFEQFGKRREVAEAAIQRNEVFPKSVLDHINEEAVIGRKYKCIRNGALVSVQTVGMRALAVNISVPVVASPCSCGLWAAMQLPCSHILAALAVPGSPLSWEPWVGACWTWRTQRDIYSAPLPAIDTTQLEMAPDLDLEALQPTGSRKKKRRPSRGESKTLAQKQRVQRTLAGVPIGRAALQEQRAAELTVSTIGGTRLLVAGTRVHMVDTGTRTCDCADFKEGNVCAHIIAAEQVPQAAAIGLESGIVPARDLLHPH
jgi:hypothetical protein